MVCKSGETIRRKNDYMKEINKFKLKKLLRRKVNVFCALTVHLMLLSNLWSSVFVCSSPFVLTHVSPQNSGLSRCNLGMRSGDRDCCSEVGQF
jgi:hypothetical protein